MHGKPRAFVYRAIALLAKFRVTRAKFAVEEGDTQLEFHLDHSIALLTRTPAALDVLLRGLPKAWTSENEGANTMSAYGVVGHLIHAERTNWIPRVKMILQSGESKAFEPFDRWAHTHASQGKTIDQLLDEFARVRAENLNELRKLNLQLADLERRGRHPVLGAVTLSQLLATWTVHDLTHLHQISRVMAHQYRQAVGPQAAYLGVLKCEGHSAQ
ncbi:MAG TPA: DinB family protein [Candidatus Acidoferrales bacterium]|nr:DinB family protein [Candidatus Acidoferrales bacterium]